MTAAIHRRGVRPARLRADVDLDTGGLELGRDRAGDGFGAGQVAVDDEGKRRVRIEARPPLPDRLGHGLRRWIRTQIASDERATRGEWSVEYGPFADELAGEIEVDGGRNCLASTRAGL